MTTVFADTFYFLALLNAHDEAHDVADLFSHDSSIRLVTTAWVLTELADGLAETDGRTIFGSLLVDLESDAQTEVIGPDEDIWRRGIELFVHRRDKGWSLTDCISFVVMGERNVTDALTADHHFEQAGFRTLLK
jgi:uncharacterized protein